MKVNNKKIAVFNNPKFIEFIINACENKVNQINNADYHIDYMPIDFNEKNLSDTAFIALFDNMMFSFLNPIESKRTTNKLFSNNKNLLISRLIYMTKISRNKNFKTDVDILKGYRNYIKLNEDKFKNQMNAYYLSHPKQLY